MLHVRRLGRSRPIPAPARFTLTGERAEALAERLLDGRGDRLDLVLDEILARGGRADRVAHDWDPVARTLRVEARAGAAGAA